ncbi:nuclear transport factor 2 family protein [Paraburkholderia sp. J41]|uniref:nuclear transport factor 2 family protein n=1 Tax=Paraburkholderia sp. J41 TaxID=2805433 RepID=UPI002AC32CE8|nr:nuclear transport factor 2 family protein [Paraburkholderia sp. J41]
MRALYQGEFDETDRHFGSDFRQRANGNWDDGSTFLARIARVREVIEHATITVLDEVSNGNRYAERFVIDLLKYDGARITQEIYVSAERDLDGRFVRIEEGTVLLEQ